MRLVPQGAKRRSAPNVLTADEIKALMDLGPSSQGPLLVLQVAIGTVTLDAVRIGGSRAPIRGSLFHLQRTTEARNPSRRRSIWVLGSDLGIKSDPVDQLRVRDYLATLHGDMLDHFFNSSLAQFVDLSA
jgi:hypothetical protein